MLVLLRKALAYRSRALAFATLLVGFLLGTQYTYTLTGQVRCTADAESSLNTCDCVSSKELTPLVDHIAITTVLASAPLETSTVAPITSYAMTLRNFTTTTPSGSTPIIAAPQLFISAEHNGRLGNLMYQFSAAYGVARLAGKQVHTFSRNELLSIFPRVREFTYVTERSEDVTNRAVLVDPKHCGFARSVIDTARANRNFTMSGYFQSYRYFEGMESEIRELFTFRSDLLAESDRQLVSARESLLRELATQSLNATNSSTPPVRVRTGTPTNFVYVALHVRRGDIMEPHFASYGYLVATGDYIRRSLSYFVDKYQSATTAIILLVFGEPSSFEWCRAELRSDLVDHIVYVSENSREQDMALISRCNATIMTVGSFGWWGAFLGGREVFYYAYPFRAGSSLSKQFYMEDYYPPNWRLFF